MSLLNHRLQNDKIRNAIKESIEENFPIENRGKTLIIKNVKIEDTLKDDNFPEQKNFKMARKTWQNPIKATLEIRDSNTNKILDSKKNVKIGALPKLTNRFTTIIEGNEYQTTNQLRRKSGVYATIQQNGVLKSEFNLSKGKNFDIYLHPISQIFSLVYKEKNRKYRLWTILHHLGLTDSDIAKVWGTKLLELNKKGALNTEASEVMSIYKILFRKEPKDFEEAVTGMRYYFSTTELSPDTTIVTLGNSYSKVTPEVLLKASQKLLSISKGNDKPDERDSLLFKDLLGVDDLLVQHFKKQQPLLKAKLSRGLLLKDNVRDIVSAATFTKPIKTFFTTGDLTSTPEQTNPLKIVSDWRETTAMGEGGITQRHAVTLETRDVQPTHLGFLDPLATPESGNVGVTVGLASSTEKGETGMTTPVINLKGKASRVTPAEFYISVVGMPDQYEIKGGVAKNKFKRVKAYYKGKPVFVKPSKVQYYMREPQSMFSFKANLVPFLPTVQSNRASMGAKMMTQAVPLDQKEKPLVQVLRSGSTTYEDVIGSYLNPVLPEGKKGTIESITKDYITIKLDSGKKVKTGLYNNFPLNQDGYLQSSPLVKVGDKVNSKTLLAENNYSVGPTLSLGKNLNVAYMSYKGYNFEDAAVMTESAASKLSHTMLHRVNVFFTPKISQFDLKKYRAHFPTDITPENAAKLDERGIIKKGSKVLPDEVVAAFLVEKELDSHDKSLRRLDKVIFKPLKKNLTKWTNEDTGIVTDVNVVGRNIDIYIKSTHPLREGDKISGRYGNKAIITKIIPDSDAPHNKQGVSIDLMLNPHGVPGRMNTGQILETAAGKIAAKTGKTYLVDNFDDPKGDLSKRVLKELKAAGLTADEVLTDGKTGPKFENKIFTGKQYIMKLRHHVDKKLASRSIGQYDINEQPQGKGTQKAGPDLTYALLAHGAKATLRDMAEIKGRKNDEYWRNIQLGLPAIVPKRNFTFDKLTNMLKGAGVNVEKDGNLLQVTPLGDKAVRKMSNGEIKDPAALLMGKNLAARKGGLFDPKVTGGANGTQWAHIRLARRMPNPMFESAIVKSLDLTIPQYNRILSGKEELDGKTGAEAIVKGLASIKVKRKINRLKKELKKAPKTNINKINTKLRNLMSLHELKMSPKEAYTMQYLPILPPTFRPIYTLPSGDIVPSDINKHYRDVGAINKTYKEGLKQKILSKDDIIATDLEVYDSLKALQGFVDPKAYGERKYKGVLKELAGQEQAKRGFIHGSAWAKRQDLSARSTITVEPSLGINQVGIPEEMARTIYRPFVIQKLKKMGMAAGSALKHYNDESALSKKALGNVMEERPLLLNRAPTLHKHSIQAFNPQITEGKSIRLNPLIVKGFNADFDGDTMAVHVPVSVESVEEARNMLPSKILFKHGDNALVPGLSQDYQLGLYYLSIITKKSRKKYDTIQDAKKAHSETKLHLTERATIGGKKMSLGQYYINNPLPDDLKDYKREMNASVVKQLLTTIGKDYPNHFVSVINKWKNLGAMYSHVRGSTLSINDFAIDRSYRDKVLKTMAPHLKNMTDSEKIEAYTKITTTVQKLQDKALSGTNNAYDMINSGSLSKAGNVRQMLSMPGVLTDVKGNPLPIPVLKSYSEGLDTADYFNTHYAARKGTVDRSVNTEKSGALNKILLTVARRLLITMTDCSTRRGIDIEVSDKNALDRFCLTTISGVVKRNDLVTTEILQKLQKAKITEFKVRSPLTCEAPQGLCQHCYGLMPDGQVPSLGTNVGALNAQAVTERSTQLTMQTFHTGGALNTGGNVVQEFPRLNQLLKVPDPIKKNKASLSPIDGTVKKVVKNLTGGFDVTVEGIVVNVPAGNRPVVAVGTKVMKGDRISDGVIMPQELGGLKDHLTAQQYIVDEMDNIYKNQFQKKTFETVVRSLSDNAIVTQAPEGSGFLRGDKSSPSYLNSLNKERKKEGLAPIKYDEYFKSVDTLNVDYPDFLTQFTTNRIKNALTTGAAQGRYANIRGKDPIPAYLYGEDFGKGDIERGEFY